MTNDRATDRAIGSKATKSPPTVHLDIDGTMELSSRPLPRQRERSEASTDPEPEPARNSTEAALRQVIRLQRLALNRQNLRIQQQRSLITRLHQSLKNQLNKERKRLDWFSALFPRKKKPHQD